MIRTITLITILLCLSACKSAQDAFTLKKKSSADEFLVEKKSPLVLPPDYSKLPVPDEEKIEKKNEEVKFKIGSNNESVSSSTEKSRMPESLENSILKKIK
tara:strand:+ start:1286 stop:1588 length:303 start_codon:yes stop_codon:yes gene_type:complete